MTKKDLEILIKNAMEYIEDYEIGGTIQVTIKIYDNGAGFTACAFSFCRGLLPCFFVVFFSCSSVFCP